MGGTRTIRSMAKSRASGIYRFTREPRDRTDYPACRRWCQGPCGEARLICLNAAANVALSEHRGQYAIRRAVAVHEGADIDDHLLAHVDAPFDRRRSHVRQEHDLSGAREAHELGLDRRLVLEHVEPCPGDAARLDQADERILVDHLPTRRIDDIGLRSQQLEAA